MNTLTKFYLVVIMIIAVSLFSRATPQVQAQEPVPFSEGMPFSQALDLGKQGSYAMFQDKEGFLWFATYSGLVRYDGAEINIEEGA